MERRKIVELGRSGARGTMVTLVGVEGSSYRQPGARMVVAEDALSYAGTVSGGCLEAEIVRKSAWKTRHGATLERYSMEFDDTADIPFGLGCGGILEVLFEPLQTPEADALLRAAEESLEGCESEVTTYLPGNGRRLRRVVVTNGMVRFASEGLEGVGIVEDKGRFVERLLAPQRLLVFGAGDDAQPLVKMAALLGWTVIVIDGRAHLATAERFPDAVRVLGPAEALADELTIGERDAAVLMTHSFEQDRQFLMETLPMRPRYLGLLGSRHRSGVLISEAAGMLGWTVEECCRNLFAPIGLDIGGEGPEAIALAVIAEVQSVRFSGVGSARRMTAAEVAAQIERGGASLYMQAQCALDAG